MQTSQHVNKTESAIRLIHIPTGITVSMQDSRSQAQNRAWAWDVLRARMSEKKRQEEQDRRNANRLHAIKNSSRGDKVRTYNFPQVSDLSMAPYHQV
jgi:peptide chain release factor 1